MQFVGRGNANVCYALNGEVYRVCVRNQTVSENNEYTLKNLEFIESKVRQLSAIRDYVVRMHLKKVPICKFWKNLLEEEGVRVDRDQLNCLVMNHLHDYEGTVDRLDHFNRIYRSNSGHDIVTWEFKPKWLYQSTEYCRNCTHNAWKGRDIRYCFRDDPRNFLETLFQDSGVPPEFLKAVLQHLESPESVLTRLHQAQEAVKDDIQTLMTLRDVTCFIQWTKEGHSVQVTIIDVDQKPQENCERWKNTEAALEALAEQMKSECQDL